MAQQPDQELNRTTEALEHSDGLCAPQVPSPAPSHVGKRVLKAVEGDSRHHHADPLTTHGIERRQVVKTMSLVFGAVSSIPALAGLTPEAIFAQGQSIHQHVSTKPAKTAASAPFAVFNAHQNETVTTICELIIPQTTTPGAKAARVNEFIDTFLGSLNASRRQEFLEGLQWIDQRSQQLFQKLFAKATTQQQTELLTRLDVTHSLEDPTGENFFRQIKSLTVYGYYTSKIGLEEELRFEGWVEYKGCTHPEHQA
jgi:hypothetical protein